MKSIAPYLYIHKNGTYYTIASNRWKSLRTKVKAEAIRRLPDALSTVRPPAPQPAQTEALQQQVVALTAQLAETTAKADAQMRELMERSQAQMAEVIALVSSGRVAPVQSPTSPPIPTIAFEDFCKRNLATLCATVAEASQRMYVDMSGKFMEALRVHQRHMRMQAARAARSSQPLPSMWEVFQRIGPGGVWNFWRDRRKSGPSSLNQLRCYIRQFVQQCCEEEILDERFGRLVQKIKMLPVQADLPTIPTMEEMSLLLAACRSVCQDTADIIDFIAFTGCRPGALETLEWKHVNFAQQLASFAQDGIREPVDLCTEALALLSKLRGNQEDPKGKVFAITGYKLKKARRILKNCVRELVKQGHADLTDMTDLKSLRHHFASAAVMAGIDFKTIALWLGHGDGGVLVAKTYGHLRRDHTKQSMAKMRFGGRKAA